MCVIVLACDLVWCSSTVDFLATLLATECFPVGLVSSVVVGFSASDNSSLSEAKAMSFNYAVMATLCWPQGPFQSQN